MYFLFVATVKFTTGVQVVSIVLTCRLFVALLGFVVVCVVLGAVVVCAVLGFVVVCVVFDLVVTDTFTPVCFLTASLTSVTFLENSTEFVLSLIKS